MDSADRTDDRTDDRGSTDHAEQLWKRFREDGDLDALGDLFDECAPGLLRIGLRLTGELDSAEDLVQETFLRALRSASRYRQRGGGVRAWLATILRNRARSIRKRRASTGHDGSGSLEAEPIDLHGHGNPVEASASRELWARLRAEVADLPEPYRTVCGLRYRHDLDASAIAAALERPLNTVQSQLRRGTRRLRERLDEGVFGALITATWDSTQTMGRAREQILDEAARIAVGGTAAITTVGSNFVLRAVALLLFLGGAGYLAWGEVESPERIAPAARTASRTTDESGAPDSSRIERSETRSITERAVADDRWPPTDMVGLDVIDGRTGAPVPGAMIRHARAEVVDGVVRAVVDTDFPPERYWPTLGLWTSDPERYWELNGTSSQSDASGRLNLPTPLTWRVSGRSGSLYGDTGWETNVEHRDGRMVLRLYPDGCLRVKVVDSHGDPVSDIGVSLRGSGDDLRSPAQRLSGRTDGRGLTVLPHVPTFARALLASGETTAVLRVYPDSGEQRIGEWPLHELLHPGPDGHCLDQPSIDVRLAEARGPIVVRVVNPLGKPPLFSDEQAWTERSWSFLNVELEEVHLRAGERERRLVTRPLIDGIARFDRPPPGRRLRVRYSFDGVEIPAAAAGSDPVEVEIAALGDDAVAWIGRALDPDGHPLRNRWLMMLDAESMSRGRPTDEDGRFCLYKDWDLEKPTDLRMRVARIVTKPCGRFDQMFPTSLASTVRLKASKPGSIENLGDLQFEWSAPIASGRFHLPESMSIEDARAWLSWQLRVEALLDGAALSDMGTPDTAVPWQRVEDAFAVLADDGSFELFGETGDAEELRVGVPRAGTMRPFALPIPFVEFAPGQTDLTLRYTQGGALEVHQVVDDLQPDVQIELERVDGSPIDFENVSRSTRHFSAPGEAKHHFFGNLVEGTYRATLTTELFSDPIAVFDNVEVRPGKTTILLEGRPVDLSRSFDGRLLWTRSSIDGSHVPARIWLDCRELTDSDKRFQERVGMRDRSDPARLTFPRQQVHALAIPQSEELGVVRFEPGALPAPDAEIVFPPATSIEVPLPSGVGVEDLASAPLDLLPGAGWEEWMQVKDLRHYFRRGMRWEAPLLRATVRCEGRWRARLEAKDGRVWEQEFEVRLSGETIRVEVEPQPPR